MVCNVSVAVDRFDINKGDHDEEIVTNELKKGDKSSVALPGFGQFIAKHRASREMRNPATGAMMMSKAKTSATFKASANLKDL